MDQIVANVIRAKKPKHLELSINGGGVRQIEYECLKISTVSRMEVYQTILDMLSSGELVQEGYIGSNRACSYRKE